MHSWQKIEMPSLGYNQQLVPFFTLWLEKSTQTPHYLLPL